MPTTTTHHPARAQTTLLRRPHDGSHTSISTIADGCRLAGAVLLTGTLTPLRAQAPQGFWNTSAEPPAGLPPALLSAPDTLIPPGMDEQLDRPAVEPGPGQWRVTGSALKPRENDVSYSVNSSGSCTYATAGDVGTVWNIEPQVP
ncbi:MAG: hypothetical protein R2712_12195 [Vicinamibacterales bacterium]